MDAGTRGKGKPVTRRLTVNCAHCGRQFSRSNPRKIYCCKQCGFDAWTLKRAGQLQSELFPAPSDALDQGRADRDAAGVDPELQARLVALLREYASQRDEVDMGGFRVWLDRRGVQLPENRNFLGRLPVIAGLRHTDRVTQSEHPNAKGRLLRVWTR